MSQSLWARGVGRFRRSLGKRLFDGAAARVLETPPLPVRGGSPLFLSMVCHRDVAAYLLAVKSIYLGVGEGRVAIINDGSLDERDLATLRHHIPGLEVFDIAAVHTGRCPRGGTWERLVKIVELTAVSYVIQIDADTLVSGPIPEVIACWRENRSFLLGTDVGQQIAPAPVTAKMVRGWIKKYNWDPPRFAPAAEASLDRLSDAEQRKYVHASSGFAGFARGMFRLADLEAFSDEMRQILGARWDEWGSEQISSNYILANAPDAVVLPFSRYACFEPHIPPGERPFLHFIGTYRFNEGLYRQRVKRFLAQYSAKAQQIGT